MSTCNTVFVGVLLVGVAAFAHSCGKIEAACWDKEPGDYVMMRGSIPGFAVEERQFRCPGREGSFWGTKKEWAELIPR